MMLKNIPLWGKIAGGCGILVVLFLLISGCAGIFLIAASDGPEPTADPETTTVQEETIPEEPEIDTTGGINTCIPDQDQSMAEVVVDFTSADVTIYTDQVYVVAENTELSSFYVVAGSDVGTILIYIEDVDGDSPMGYAANDIAYDYTMLVFPEDLGADPIDVESDTYQVAVSCLA